MQRNVRQAIILVPTPDIGVDTSKPALLEHLDPLGTPAGFTPLVDLYVSIILEGLLLRGITG